MPENIIAKLCLHIKPQWKLAFFSSIFFGFLTHMYIFTNYLPNHDGILSLYTPQHGSAMGRFFLAPFNGISSYFDLPWISGLLSVFYLALVSVVLTELFDLKKKIAVVLISGLFITFPPISATFSYMFTADGYMLATLAIVVALFLTKRYKYGFLPGGLLLYLGVGVYQANLSVLLSIGTLIFILEILANRTSLRDLTSLFLRFLGMNALGMGLYFISFRIYTHFFAGEVLDYQGMDQAVTASFNLVASMLQVNNSIIDFFLRGFYSDSPINLFEVLNLFIIILIIISFCAIVLQNRLYQQKWMVPIAVFLVLSLPISGMSLFFISSEVWYHMLMKVGLISFYLLPVLIYEHLTVPTYFAKVTSWITVLLTSAIIFNSALIANISYLNQELKYEQSMAFMNRMIMRIEQTEGVTEQTPIAFIGRPSLESEFSTSIVRSKIPPMTGSLQQVLLRDERHFTAVMENQFGLHYSFLTEEELATIRGSEEFQEMDSWPAATSIQLVGDVLIIKMD